MPTVSRFAASLVLAVLTLPVGSSADADSRAQDNSKGDHPAEGALAELPALDSIAAQLDLRIAPPRNAYAITGDFLPPFLQAVLLAWNREFPQTPLSANSIIFVIRPSDFYSDLDPNQRNWLASREMLGIRNFPLIINPLTPGDDWYLRAQKEWREGNQDPIYVLLTSLHHEIVHTQQAGDERQAYKAALDLFEAFRKQGKLRGAYASACYVLLRARYADLRRHPDQYVQVRIRFQQQDVALLVRSRDASPLP